MAPPPAKRKKVERLPKSPIIFQPPGLKPDVSLKVFDVSFYVHSVVLKLHSAFFRKFLDATNKTASPSTNGTLKLEASDSASDGTTPLKLLLREFLKILTTSGSRRSTKVRKTNGISFQMILRYRGLAHGFLKAC